MSSISIYSHVPYFYVIQHIPSGKFYGGSRWAKGCNPIEFMVKGGYTTSSDTINDLITEDGLNSFKIILILEEPECCMPVYEYETVFLQSNDIANNENWLNLHNNIRPSFGSNEFKNIMINKYGVDNCMRNVDVVEKMRENYTKLCGVGWSSQNPNVRNLMSVTLNNNYGVDIPAKSSIILNRMQTTCLDRYGETNPFKVEKFKIKAAETNLEKYGVENAMKSPTIQAVLETTCLEKYGVTNYSKTEEFRQLASELHSETTCWNDGITNYKFKKGVSPPEHLIRGMLKSKPKGYKYYTNGIIDIIHLPTNNIPEGFILGRCKGRAMYSNGILFKIFYPSDIIPEGWYKRGSPKKQIICPHCGDIGGTGNMKRYHFDKCKLFTKILS